VGVVRPPPSHRATTAHLQALYPFVSDPSPGRAGPLVGRDLFGGPFCFDPWALYGTGRITNPNVVVLGQLGRGKSTFIKTLVWRQAAFGRRAWIVDPKGEYGPLARACGTRPLVLVPGGESRLNPLDPPGSGADRAAMVRGRVELVASLLASSLGRPLGPEDRTALELAVRSVSAGSAAPTLPQLVEALLEPDASAAASVGTDRAGLTAAGRVAALELRRMVRGDLAGMFDGPTRPRPDRAAPAVVLDLSATFASPALPLIMTCATAWLQTTLTAGDGVKRLVVVDEGWAILKDLATARWLQATFKLSRALGVANVVVVHRISDLLSSGADGSTQQQLAGGLLADSETRVVFGQPANEAEATGRDLGLSRTEVETISRLPRGFALWRVGTRSHLVEHVLAACERVLTDTDAAMRR
jgi:type IV secretory pathway VirB4 component